MADKISALEDRVAQVLKLVDQLRKENGNLKRQNVQAAEELNEARQALFRRADTRAG